MQVAQLDPYPEPGSVPREAGGGDPNAQKNLARTRILVIIIMGNYIITCTAVCSA